MYAIFGGKKGGSKFVPPKASIVNKDTGFLSRIFVSILKNSGVKKGIVFEEEKCKEAYEKLRDQEVSAVVIFPENFTSDFLDERVPEITIIKNPSQVIYPRIVETFFEILSEIVNYSLTYFYFEFKKVKVILKDFERGKDIDFSSSDLNKFVEGAREKGKKVFNLLKDFRMEIKEDNLNKRKNFGNFISYFFPGYSLFFILFIANMVMVSIVEDEKNLTKRLFLTHLTPFKYLIAKFLSGSFFLFVISLFFCLCGYFIFGLRVYSLILLLLILATISFAFPSIFLFTSSIAGSKKGAQNYGMIAIFFMASTGGGTIPVPFLPNTILKISSILPFYNINKMVINLTMMGKVEPKLFLFSILMGALFFILGLIIFMRRLELK